MPEFGQLQEYIGELTDQGLYVPRPRSDSERSLHRLLYKLFQDLRTEKSAYTKEWQRNERYYDGDFYGDLADELAELKTVMTFNELKTHVRLTAAWLTDRTPKLQVFPADDRASSQDIDERARWMQRILTAAWTTKLWYLVAHDFIVDALVYGSGVLSFYWDPFALKGLGDISCERISPWNFYVDANATSLSDAWVVAVAYDSYPAELQALFPETFDPELHGLPKRRQKAEPRLSQRGRAESATIAAGTWSGGEIPQPSPRTIQRDRIQESSTGALWADQGRAKDEQPSRDTLRRYRLYLRDVELVPTGKRYYWHVFDFTDRQVLAYGKEYELPFVHLRFARHHARPFWGESLVDMVRDVQRSLNLLLAKLSHQIHLTSDPILLEERGATEVQQPKRKQPGETYVVMDGYIDRIRWLTPPQLQPQAFQLVLQALDFMEKTSGMSGPMRAASAEQRVLVGTQQMAMEATQVLVRHVSKNFEGRMERGLTYAANLLARSMLVGRRVPLTDDESLERYLDLPDRPFMTPEGDPLDFVIHWETGTAMGVNRSLRDANAIRYYSLTQGFPGPLWLARQLGIEAAAEMVEEAKSQREQALAPKQATLDSSLARLSEATGALRKLTKEVARG